MSKYSCIILDPDMPSRMKLKQATTQVSDFGKVVHVGTVNDANGLLDSADDGIDIIFVSTRFDNEIITNFINNAKACKAGQDTAYIMIMKAQGSGTVAQNMLMGGDSVLCEPYSVDSMLEITRLAAQVKKERADARERIAITLLTNDIQNQLDLIACLKASGCEPGTSIKKFRDICATIKALPKEKIDFYFETLINKMIEARVPPKALGNKKYTGVSSRVKKRMETKLIAAIDKNEKPTV